MQPYRLRSSRPVDPFQLVEVLTVDLGVGAEEVKVGPERLPFRLAFHLLLDELVALAFVNVKNVDFHVLGPARQISKDGSSLAQLPDHVTADVTGEDRTGERILEQNLDHFVLFVMKFDAATSAPVPVAVRKSTEKRHDLPHLFLLGTISGVPLL